MRLIYALFCLMISVVGISQEVHKGKPQEPVPPFSYIEEEVKVWQGIDSINLAGTFTIPKAPGPFPTAILITGSGPQDRDSDIFGHKPFKVIADHLTKNGIAVLRMDDRGIGQSEGVFETATSLDFKNDIQAAYEFLSKHKKVDPDKIGLIGHSEGGLIGPMVAAANNKIAFVVMLAGPGVTGAEVLFDQNKVILAKSGLSPESLSIFEKYYPRILSKGIDNRNSKDLEKLIQEEVDEMFAALKPAQRSFFGGNPNNYSYALSNLFQSDWYFNFLIYDPLDYLPKVSCPILAVNGELDVQVTPKINLEGIDKILKENNHADYTIREYPKLNHLFQTATTGMPDEYGKSEETFNVKVLDGLTSWITSRFIKN